MHNLPGNLPGAAAPDPWTRTRWGHRAKRTSSPWRSPSCCYEVCSGNSWSLKMLHWLNLRPAEIDCSTDRWLSHRSDDIIISRWQWCLTIFAECPLVLLTELSVKKRSNGIIDRPLYNLNTSNRSARFRLSSNDHDHMPRCWSLLSYDICFNPWTILVNLCCTRSIVVICIWCNMVTKLRHSILDEGEPRSYTVWEERLWIYTI